MATVQNVLDFARAQSQTDANGLTDAKGLIFTNEALVDFHRRLVEHGVDAASVQEAYVDGTIPATAGNGSTFLYPSDMILLKAIEVNFADTTAQNYVRAEQADVSNLSGENSFSYLRQNCSQLHPKFDDHGDWYEIFHSFQSGDNLSQAIRIFYFQKPTEYTATTDTITYPGSLDYRILAWRVAADYAYSLGPDKIVMGDKFNSFYEERVRDLLSTLGRGSQQPLKSVPIQLTGWEY